MASTSTTMPAGDNRPAVYFDSNLDCWIFRASSINNCTKQLVLTWLGVSGSSPPADMQRRYDDGHLHEASIIEEIGNQRPGWTIQPVDPDTGEQFEVEIVVREPEPGKPGIIIRGHTDGLGINLRMNPDSRILEAKAFSQGNYDKALKLLERSNAAFFAAYPYYRDQATIYMSALEVPMTWGIKNKNTGEVHVFDVDEVPGDIDALIANVIEIDRLGQLGDIPTTCDKKSYPCPMWRFHDESEQAEAKPDDDEEAASDWSWDDDGELVETKTDLSKSSQAELIRLCNEYVIARDAEKAAKARKSEIGRRIREGWLTADESAIVTIPGFEVKLKSGSRTDVDRDALAADGIDVSKYLYKNEWDYPFVTEK